MGSKFKRKMKTKRIVSKIWMTLNLVKDAAQVEVASRVKSQTDQLNKTRTTKSKSKLDPTHYRCKRLNASAARVKTSRRLTSRSLMTKTISTETFSFKWL